MTSNKERRVQELSNAVTEMSVDPSVSDVVKSLTFFQPEPSCTSSKSEEERTKKSEQEPAQKRQGF